VRLFEEFAPKKRRGSAEGSKLRLLPVRPTRTLERSLLSAVHASLSGRA
jgi:hypothetical protein